MATNLVRRCSPEQAHHLLNLSFAQYRADADIVRLESQLDRARHELVAATESARCELGDVFEYMELAGRPSPPARPRQVVEALEALKPGDVVTLPAKRGVPRPGSAAAVLSIAQRKGGLIGVRAITAERRVVWLAPRDFTAPPAVLGRVELPVPFVPRDRGFQRQVALTLAGARPPAGRRQRQPRPSHPVASCPDLRLHLRAAARVGRLTAQVERLEKQVAGRSESLGRQFDRVLGLLERWGYVQGWSLSAAGERLARIYHPLDLLVTECTQRGLFASLAPAEMAALVSVFTYEPRGPFPPEPVGPDMPTRRLGERWRAVQVAAAELAEAEQRAGLPVTRPPDAGFARLAYGWARGKELARLLGDMSAGDFVRNMKQLIDLLRQLAGVLGDEEGATCAHQATEALFRGVVAASSVVNGTGQ